MIPWDHLYKHAAHEAITKTFEWARSKFHESKLESGEDVIDVNGKEYRMTYIASPAAHWMKFNVEVNKHHIIYELWNADGAVFTRVRLLYVNPSGFRFTIYSKKSLLDWATRVHEGTISPDQDIEIGDPEFDERFIIQANDEDKIRKLLAKPKIRELIQNQKQFYLQVRDNEDSTGTRLPDNVDELYFQVRGKFKEEDFGSQIPLFVEILNHLCRIGGASRADPKVNL